jgi:hypothetical protein
MQCVKHWSGLSGEEFEYEHKVPGHKLLLKVFWSGYDCKFVT